MRLDGWFRWTIERYGEWALYWILGMRDEGVSSNNQFFSCPVVAGGILQTWQISGPFRLHLLTHYHSWPGLFMTLSEG